MCFYYYYWGFGGLSIQLRLGSPHKAQGWKKKQSLKNNYTEFSIVVPFWGCLFSIVNLRLVGPKEETTMETIGTFWSFNVNMSKNRDVGASI